MPSNAKVEGSGTADKFTVSTQVLGLSLFIPCPPKLSPESWPVPVKLLKFVAIIFPGCPTVIPKIMSQALISPVESVPISNNKLVASALLVI